MHFRVIHLQEVMRHTEDRMRTLLVLMECTLTLNEFLSARRFSSALRCSICCLSWSCCFSGDASDSCSFTNFSSMSKAVSLSCWKYTLGALHRCISVPTCVGGKTTMCYISVWKLKTAGQHKALHRCISVPTCGRGKRTMILHKCLDTLKESFLTMNGFS